MIEDMAISMRDLCAHSFGQITFVQERQDHQQQDSEDRRLRLWRHQRAERACGDTHATGLEHCLEEDY